MITKREPTIYLYDNFKITLQKNIDNIHWSALREYGIGCKNYLEIGTNYGNSAYQVWSSLKPELMVLVDIFPEKKMISHICRTLTNIDCMAKVYIYKCKSSYYFTYLNTNMFDLILVDGDHTTNSAKLDIENAWKCLLPGGTIIFDDIDIKRLKEMVLCFVNSVNDVDNFIVHEEWKHGCIVIKKRKM